MTLLIAGLAVFILIHLVPCIPLLRKRIVSTLGESSYKGVFSVLSVVGVVLIVAGLKRAETIPLYDPPVWGRPVTYLLVFFAVYLFLSSPVGSAPSSAKYWTAHPLSWGVFCWSVGHLLSNGDKAHVILFCSLLVYSMVNMYSGNLRGQKPAIDQRPPLISELVFVVIVALVYAGLFWGHRYFTGMPLM